MSISLEERLLIDRYLEGALSGLELQQFMERLDSDEDFRARVSMQNLLVEGIVRSADKELQERLIESLAYKKSRIPFGLKLIMTFLILTIAGISLWNYIGSDKSVERENFLSFSWLSHSSNDEPGSSDKKDRPPIEEGNSEKVNAKGSNTSSMKHERNEEVSEPESETEFSDSLETLEQSTELVVKKDQMLISQSLVIHEDTIGQGNLLQSKSTPSPSRQVAKKLNPMAGLEMPEEGDKTITHINVEFWVSPINYKGYKFFRNKIILFGIDEPDAVILFRRKDNIYMRHLDNYYLLEPTEEFTSYQSVEVKEFSSLQKR